jgi:hypothetical protein
VAGDDKTRGRDSYNMTENKSKIIRYRRLRNSNRLTKGV